MTHEAEYEGRCPECGGKITLGTRITSATGAVWVHAVCPPGKLDLAREVCSGCFTEKSVTGTCMCEAVA